MQLTRLYIPAVCFSLHFTCHRCAVRSFRREGPRFRRTSYPLNCLTTSRIRSPIGVGIFGLGGASFVLGRYVTTPTRNRWSKNPPPFAATMLDFDVDNYNGVIVKESSFPTTTEDFVRVLQTSVEAWKDERRRGVWLKVPVGRAELITVALAEGFELHHAEKAYVMLNRWLPSSENSLPPNASHQVGIGALVLNDSKEVLVVRERRGKLLARDNPLPILYTSCGGGASRGPIALTLRNGI
ncbi:unnamed protein product [Choristocarpus tenellus]